ncbi:hypothetical protein COCSADRAFT_275095 [Bipolaris sorokiniana ND90Pr]|uniref:Uncharacterized protein n=1 Tax=Cochliobolus sativus (strain ND90Pr / ATCC 201652) TaxID=665912 RepID=M2T2G4_COCSN|nr:uncharacterized protein COCSADRAFT_275095 [Bipolaris sorokiniana ND90Pr]EMD68665.1 hypothetical protein COCSADRAFT_275095 [Bipolaris sorokiniana ND90Pr]
MLNARAGWLPKEQVFAVRRRSVHWRRGSEQREAATQDEAVVVVGVMQSRVQASRGGRRRAGGARQQHVELDAGTYVVGTCPRPSIHPHTPTYICTHIHLYPQCSWATPAPVTHRTHRSKQLTSISEAHAHARGTSTSTRLTDEQWRRERQPADPVQVCERRIVNNTARLATAVGKTRPLHCSPCSLAWLAGEWLQ